jgi:hypothetical protein
MNRYQLLKKNEEIIYQFIKNGIISYQIIRDMEIYETFIQMDNTTNELKYIILADDYELSSQRVKQIITTMKIKTK